MVSLTVAPVGAAEASELVAAKECSWSCLYADGPACVCVCDGAFHGDRLHDSPRKQPRTVRNGDWAEQAECGCWAFGDGHIDCARHHAEKMMRRAARHALETADA